jgi:hypothetical protein
MSKGGSIVAHQPIHGGIAWRVLNKVTGTLAVALTMIGIPFGAVMRAAGELRLRSRLHAITRAERESRTAMRLLKNDQLRMMADYLDGSREITAMFCRGSYKSIEEAETAWSVAKQAQQSLAKIAIKALEARDFR